MTTSSKRTATRTALRLAAVAAFVLAAAMPERTEAEAEGEAKDGAAKLLGVNPDRDRRKLGDPDRMDFAKALGQDVVCLCGTCPRHTVTNCDCGWAHFNQRVIQLALLEGKTREMILSAYEAAYGLKVFPLPPDEGFGRVSYLGPYAVAGLGLILVIFLGLRMRNRPGEAPVSPASASAGADLDDDARAALARELDDLD